MSKVFISHQKRDSEQATNVADYLKYYGIGYYLDIYDKIKGSSGFPIENYLIDVMNSCTHFLTILSNNTEDSWWVPFEIGVATDKDIPIANYFYKRIEIPSYLENWPKLFNLRDLDKYIKLIKIGRHEMLLDHKIAGIYPRYSEVFHRELKEQLNY